VKLLLLDFVLLLLMCRQLIVFRIEARYENSVVTYPGGTNTSVLNDIEGLGTVKFTNPTHDFIDKIRNYLDIAKRFVFLLFFWAALAIVFLTGTSRVNILSIGYIIGSFIFLWQGTDFYLRPIYVIISWWNKLILYNVSVVVIKSFLQLFGCIVLNMDSVSSLCWLVQVRFGKFQVHLWQETDNRPTKDLKNSHTKISPRTASWRDLHLLEEANRPER
jgi:piezo-type mechanosensitive ion channel component 1/2